jgi:hypothetical protein
VNDLCVVVRSIRERTEEACLRVVRSQLEPGSPLYVVRDKPFAEAHIESMHLAVEANTRWSLFLDADVLLRKGAIAQMLREAEAISIPFYMLNFRILDRGFNGPAFAGVHLYATKYLSTAIRFKEAMRLDQRPESRLCAEMARRAEIPTLSSTQLVGLHGYEQFYADLYRTVFARAVKFGRHFDYFLRVYRDRYRHNNGDYDNKVLLWGLLDGTLYKFEHDNAPLDKRHYQTYVQQMFLLLDTKEKGPLVHSQDKIERTIREHTPDQHYRANQDWICPPDFIAHPVPDNSLRKRVKEKTLRFMLYFGRRVKKVIADSLDS